MATIKDIARMVGVSPTTVSNVIHGNSNRVSAETIQRINDAIATLHYVPNMSARSLVCNASHIIGLINSAAPGTTPLHYQDPFRGALLSGIEAEVNSRGYYLMVRNVSESAQLAGLLANWNLDGLIVASQFSDDFYDDLLRYGKPFLVVDSYLDVPGIMQVQLEDKRGGFLATEYLIKRGHRRIIFASSALSERGVMHERYLGYREALYSYGLPFDPAYVYSCGSNDDNCALGRELACRSDYTAIFATADILAAELVSGLTQSGRTVPGDVSIIGYDDLNIARLTSPPLTTVRQDVLRKGRLAADMLINAITRPDPTAPKCVVLPVEIVERDSVRDISADSR